MKRRTSSIKKKNPHNTKDKRSSGSFVPSSSSSSSPPSVVPNQPDVAGLPPLHTSSSFLPVRVLDSVLPWFRPSRNDADKKKKETKHHDTNDATDNKNHTDRRAVVVMELAVGLLIISATVLAWRNHVLDSTTTPPTQQQRQQQQLESALQRRDQLWGEDFDGVATITNQYQVLQRLPHNSKDYTQGLQWYNQRLVESTGMYGQSQVKIWNPFNHHDSNNQVDKVIDLDAQYFGEGLCWFQDVMGRDRYIQLTWQEKTAFVYDAQLELIHQFNYTTETTEGWGITFDPLEQVFYVSDGSDTILVWDLNFERIRSFRVTLALRRQGKRTADSYLRLINELEWDSSDQTLMANVWFQDAIVKIHPRTGQVLQVWDFSKLYTNRDGAAEVMNGIAHYQGNQWWITGKYWPFLYLVELDSVHL